MPAALEWLADDRFRVGDVEFVETHRRGSTVDRFHIRKKRSLVDRTASLLSEHVGGRIVELGVAQGGSAALIELLAAPSTLVGLELSPERIPALDELIARRGARDRVHVHHGVDQGDRVRVRALVDAATGGRPLDLVIDDASHLLGPTTATFETLFPLLGPGGRYVIEDWNWQHKVGRGFREALRSGDREAGERFARAQAEGEVDPAVFHAALARRLRDPTSPDRPALVAAMEERAAADPEFARMLVTGDAPSTLGRAAEVPEVPEDRRPLAALAIDLMLMAALDDGIVGSVSIDDCWVTATRGPAPLDGDTFRVSEHAVDQFGLRWP